MWPSPSVSDLAPPLAFDPCHFASLCYLVIHSSVRRSIIELFIATSKLCSTTRWSSNRMCNCLVVQYHQTGHRLQILAMHQESTRMRWVVLKGR
ncbi:uncharacterized protein LOC107608351 isoform X2 [Arachis ipaensis]|uniref:uncharacterized protein LOC107608351 isoform X2 n=1 Tax=Arachis ipaensis TaxID=130454 RepID=UPI000A2B39AB|nr:uncharacterized protein LOC107608351 isoform X2 [Arachis ipaensis]